MRAHGRFSVLLLQSFQDFTRTRDDGGREAREFGDLNAVGTVGCAGLYAMQEDDVVVHLLDIDGDVGDVAQSSGQRCHLMIMGCEECAAF